MVVKTIISTIVEAITGMLAGLGSGIVGFFDSALITKVGEVSSLSSFGVMTLALIGAGLAFGLVRMLISKIKI